MVAQARANGLRWEDLQNGFWSRLSRGQYVAKDLCHHDEVILRGVEQRMPANHAFSGRTAAWFLGLDVSPIEPIEVTIPRELPVRSRAGIKLRRTALPAADVIKRRGFRITSPLRTVRDLGSGRDFTEALALVDMAVRMSLVQLSELHHYVLAHPGEKGIKRLRRVASFANPGAESPMESRLRAHLICAKLPVPLVQTKLCDRNGNFVARADLCYPESKLVIEYDGEHHKEHLASDLRRQNSIVNAGYKVLRFTAADLHAPALVADQVRRALKRAG